MLRPTREADVDPLATIRATPEVRRWWRGRDLRAETLRDMVSDDLHTLTIEDLEGAVVGAIYFEEEPDPDYRCASIDIFLDLALRGRGLGVEAIRVLARYLFEERGHHRLTIDPAVDNLAAIRAYAKVGFREVGVMRQYERGHDGTWHDGLLMDLLAGDLDRGTGT